MFDFGINVPYLTDAGARDLRIAAEIWSARSGETKVPSGRTALIVTGALLVLSYGWLALEFYKVYQQSNVGSTVTPNGRGTGRLP